MEALFLKILIVFASTGAAAYVVILCASPFVAVRDIQRPLDPAWSEWTDWDATPGKARDYFTNQRPRIEALGFEPARSLRCDPKLEHENAFALAFVHPQSGDIAIAFCGVQPMLVESYVEFRTVYDDGTAIFTRNGPVKPEERSVRPQKRLYWFPKHADAEALYTAHQAFTRDADRTKVRRMPDRDDVLDRFVGDIKGDHQHALDQGLLVLDADTGMLHLTFRWAILLTWSHIWPMSFVVRHRRRKRDRLALKRARGG